MAPNTIWHEETYVRSSETDFQQRWKVSSFFAAIVEAAAHHADHLGFGFESMMAQDRIWVLSRLKICFYGFPKIEDRLVIETWPKGLQQKLFFMRDYHVLAQDGTRLASATSAYVLISPRARRMLMPQSLNGTVPDNEGRSALDEVLDRIPSVETVEDQFAVQAGYSAVDLMGHVNNTRYIDWICDCFSFDEHQGQTLSWLQVNYLNEVKPGERVMLQRGAFPDRAGAWYITGNNLTSGMKAFEAAVGWKPQCNA